MKEYIGSDEHFQDEVQAHHDLLEEIDREQNDLQYKQDYDQQERQQQVREREVPPRDGCAGERDVNDNDFSCGYDSIIDCSECIYTEHGRKNPQAKCNQRKENK